jgi:hypothetical protein
MARTIADILGARNILVGVAPATEQEPTATSGNLLDNDRVRDTFHGYTTGKIRTDEIRAAVITSKAKAASRLAAALNAGILPFDETSIALVTDLGISGTRVLSALRKGVSGGLIGSPVTAEQGVQAIVALCDAGAQIADAIAFTASRVTLNQCGVPVGEPLARRFAAHLTTDTAMPAVARAGTPWSLRWIIPSSVAREYLAAPELFAQVFRYCNIGDDDCDNILDVVLGDDRLLQAVAATTFTLSFVADQFETAFRRVPDDQKDRVAQRIVPILDEIIADASIKGDTALHFKMGVSRHHLPTMQSLPIEAQTGWLRPEHQRTIRAATGPEAVAILTSAAGNTIATADQVSVLCSAGSYENDPAVLDYLADNQAVFQEVTAALYNPGCALSDRYAEHLQMCLNVAERAFPGPYRDQLWEAARTSTLITKNAMTVRRFTSELTRRWDEAAARKANEK